MLILLPPSEGKTAPAAGSPVHVEGLSAPTLAPYRRKVLEALIELSARPDALATLKVGPKIAPDVAANLLIEEAPTAPAAQVYTGVLYAAAGFARADLPGYSPARMAHSVRTISALWGAVSPLDLIPAYRLSMGVDLPGVGSLPAFWRPALDDVLQDRASGDVVVDCRSAQYIAAWRPEKGTDWVSVKVLRDLDGKRSVVSHNAKHTRGLIAGHLITRAAPEPTTGDELLEAVTELVGTELTGARLIPGPAGSRVLEVVVR